MNAVMSKVKAFGACSVILFACKAPMEEGTTRTNSDARVLSGRAPNQTSFSGPNGVDHDCEPAGANCVDHGFIAGVCDMDRRCIVPLPPAEIRDVCDSTVEAALETNVTRFMNDNNPGIRRWFGAGPADPLFVRVSVDYPNGETAARLISNTCASCNNGVISLANIKYIGVPETGPCVAGIDLVPTYNRDGGIPDDGGLRDGGTPLNDGGIPVMHCNPETTSRLAGPVFSQLMMNASSVRSAAHASSSDVIRVTVTLSVHNGHATVNGILASSPGGNGTLPTGTLSLSSIPLSEYMDCYAVKSVSIPPL